MVKKMKIRDKKNDVSTIISTVLSNPTLSNKLVAVLGSLYDRDSFISEYFLRSNDKSLSNELEIEFSDNTYDSTTWAYRITFTYIRKWIKLLDTYDIEFDVTKPYNMALNDKLKTDHMESSDSGQSLVSNESTDTNSYQGFNSSSFSDTDKSTNDTTTGTERSSTYERDHNSERDITRSGHIGNRSVPQLIEEYRDFSLWNIYNVMFKDIDRHLCSRIWDVEIK